MSEMIRLKYVSSINEDVLGEDADPDLEFLYVDISAVGQGTLALPAESTRFSVAPSRARRLAVAGDTVVSTVRTYLRAVTEVPTTEDPLVFSTGFAVVSPDRQRVYPRYLTWQLQADNFISTVESISTGVSYPATSAAAIGDIGVRIPPLDVQRAVADFLDRETAKIDTLLAKQEELGHAVREHLHGVQDGLVSLSEGGVRFKYLVDEVDCRAGAEWERLPLLSVSIHWGVRRRDEVTDDLPRAEDLSNYKVVESGDIVVNRMRAFQGALGRSPIDGIVSPDYLVLRAAANVRSDWLAAAMRTPEFISEMAARVRGIGSAELGTVRTPRINADELGEIRLAVPTLAEQEARYITRQRSESQAAVLLERIDSLTDALKERRAALITAAVTGKLDVSTYGKAG